MEQDQTKWMEKYEEKKLEKDGTRRNSCKRMDKYENSLKRMEQDQTTGK